MSNLSNMYSYINFGTGNSHVFNSVVLCAVDISREDCMYISVLSLSVISNLTLYTEHIFRPMRFSVVKGSSLLYLQNL